MFAGSIIKYQLFVFLFSPQARSETNKYIFSVFFQVEYWKVMNNVEKEVFKKKLWTHILGCAQKNSLEIVLHIRNK